MIFCYDRWGFNSFSGTSHPAHLLFLRSCSNYTNNFWSNQQAGLTLLWLWKKLITMNCVFLVHIVFFPRINIFFTFFICFCFFVLLFNIFYAPSYFLICPSILFSKWPNKIISQLITFPPAFLSPSSSLGFHVDSCFPDTLHDSHHGFPFLCPCVGSPVS